MRRFGPLLATFVIIAIVLCSYTVSKTVVNPINAPRENVRTEVEYVSINITYEDCFGVDELTTVQEAIQMLPTDVVKDFVDKDWKIVIVSEINAPDVLPEGDERKIQGLTDYEAKTIQVCPIERSGRNLKLTTIHEMCHFAGEFYNHAPAQKEWIELYKKYGDSYVEYEYNGVDSNDKNKADLEYAGSDEYEFFACSMKDFLVSPEYVKTYYPDLYTYFKSLTK